LQWASNFGPDRDPATWVLETSVTAEIRQLMGGRPAALASPVRVAVFSDQELIRAGLTRLLARHPDRAVAIDTSTPGIRHDVVVFDLTSATGSTRAPVLRQLQRLVEGQHLVVAVTRDPCDEMTTRIRAMGCAEVVPVSVTAEELVHVLETVAGPSRAGDCQATPHRVLTKRESEIVDLVARGLSNAEIAQELFLSVNSVKTYIRTAYRKMGVTTRSQAVLWAVRGGLGADGAQHRQ
jgi:NarL family two-component system response regulator LiaR